MSTVRLAATVILARPPFEVYLARRSASSAFAPDAFVFPGGTIEAQDTSRAARARTIGLEPDRLGREFRAAIPDELASDEPAVECDGCGARSSIAALRELFEEAGVLLARTARDSPSSAVGSDLGARCGGTHRGAQRRPFRFADFLARSRLVRRRERADALLALDHAAERAAPLQHALLLSRVAPADQAALADALETHDGIWISPADALGRRARAALHLVYPTIKHLERLNAFRLGRRGAGVRAQQTGAHDRADGMSPTILRFRHLRERVVTLVRAPNPSAMTLQGTNSYVLDCGERRRARHRSGTGDRSALRSARRRRHARGADDPRDRADARSSGSCAGRTGSSPQRPALPVYAHPKSRARARSTICRSKTIWRVGDDRAAHHRRTRSYVRSRHLLLAARARALHRRHDSRRRNDRDRAARRCDACVSKYTAAARR